MKTDAALPPGLVSIPALGAGAMLRLLHEASRLDPCGTGGAPLSGTTLVNAFFEDSTRTRVSFELAALRLGARVVNLSGAGSSVAKGETLLDTVRTLDAMRPDFLVVRHARSGVMGLIQRWTSASVVNAGDGRHQHPTQALLDMLTIAERFGRSLDPAGEPSVVLRGLHLAIVGDVLHSRVARSTAQAALMLGARVTLVGPRALCPDELTAIGDGCGGPIAVARGESLDELVREVDVVYALRIQLERQGGGVLFPSASEYARCYRIERRHLSMMRAGAIVMHPGPVNRGVELSEDAADDRERSAIQEQVMNGVRVRMATLAWLREARG